MSLERDNGQESDETFIDQLFEGLSDETEFLLISRDGVRYLHIDEVSRSIKVSNSRMRGLLLEGRIEGVKPGYEWFVSVESASDYDEKGRKPAGRPRKIE